MFYLRNGWRVWRANSLGRGKSSPASLDLAAQSTSARYCSNSVISPNHCVPLSLEMLTTLGRSHGPRQPLIVSCTLFSSPLARHSFLSQSTGTGGLPFSVKSSGPRVVPAKLLWQMKRASQARDQDLVARGELSAEDLMLIKPKALRRASIRWPNTKLSD